MQRTYAPTGYHSVLNIYETQTAIGLLHRAFEDRLGKALNLKRVSAPLFVEANTGLNDNLNGIERPVAFDVAQTGKHAEIVHSLAKWKRMALYQYGFRPGEGLYTDMNAIRRDEELDNLHSIYVDQWDWERVITAEQRNEAFLKDIVRRLVEVITGTHEEMRWQFPQLTMRLKHTVTFITTQELEDLYPDKTPKEREDAFTKEHKTVFLMQIGGPLKSGQRHDGRAPDYDDWSLNGDILFWNELLGCAFEISSMGIRVDREAMDVQLTIAGCDDRRNLLFHRMLLQDELPLTIGGGIGQSRLCMLLLEKAHIGEVQVSMWDDEIRETCKGQNIFLL